MGFSVPVSVTFTWTKSKEIDGWMDILEFRG